MIQSSDGTSDLDHKGIGELAMDYAIHITERSADAFGTALRTKDEMMRRYGPLMTDEAIKQAVSILRMVDP